MGREEQFRETGRIGDLLLQVKGREKDPFHENGDFAIGSVFYSCLSMISSRISAASRTNPEHLFPKFRLVCKPLSGFR